MRRRHALVEQFSTFIQLDSQGFQTWLADPRLVRSMQQCSAQWDADSTFWGLYWWKTWQDLDLAAGPQPSPQQPSPQFIGLALNHLTAYLQESAYWAAVQISRKYSHTTYGVGDFFQMAIADLPKLLPSFNPERGSGLASFTEMVLSSALRDQLRQRQLVDLCSNWSLLRKISKKRLRLALTQAGVGDAQARSYELAWFCFNTCYEQPPGQQQVKLAAELWQAMADLYDQQAPQWQLAQRLSASQLEVHLNQCAQWVRQYLYPPTVSLPTGTEGQDNVELWQDSWQVPWSQTGGSPVQGLEGLLAQEALEGRAQCQSQMQMVLTGAIAALDAQSAQILQLYYQQGLTQQQIRDQMKISQPTVARRLNKARQALLQALVEWRQAVSPSSGAASSPRPAQNPAQKTAPSPVNNSADPNLVIGMGAALEEWLYSQNLANSPDKSL